MCGILFSVSIKDSLNRNNFNRALDTLSHRGPDCTNVHFFDNDLCALGHKRLTIQDLSSKGNQPMNSENLWVIFNGEIYNYPKIKNELIKKGYMFRTECDTEVLLHGYKEWGSKLCDYIDGMFSFVIWDDQNKKIFGARDPFGQKPLYFKLSNNELVISSEIKSIKSLNGHKFLMRKSSLFEFLFYDYVPSPNTWYQGINQLEPGHFFRAEIKPNGINFESTKYWSFELDPSPPPISSKNAITMLMETLSYSVKEHMLSDVEVGAFLSGGIDSNCIVYEANKLIDKPLKTFCSGYESVMRDEREIALNAAKFYRTDHFEKVVDENDIMLALKRSVSMFDQPFGDPSQIPTWSIANYASKYVKVSLSGDGGDEVMGGYWNYGDFSKFPDIDFSNLESFFHSLKIRRIGLKKWQNLRENFTHYLFPVNEISNWVNEDFIISNPYWYFEKNVPSKKIDIFRRSQWVDLKTYLPGSILEKVDRCSMANSLETRSPFLSKFFVEKMLNLPVEITNPSGKYKYLFRKAYRKNLPDSVINGSKKGFSNPETMWGKFINSKQIWSSIDLLRQIGLITPMCVQHSRTSFKLTWRLCLIYECIKAGYFADYSL